MLTLRSNEIHNYSSSYTTKSGIVRTVSQYAEEAFPVQSKSPFTTNTSNSPLGPQLVMYVRALYDYEADDRTSLSFHEGDIIQVITQLESGWWDGVINGVR